MRQGPRRSRFTWPQLCGYFLHVTTRVDFLIIFDNSTKVRLPLVSLCLTFASYPTFRLSRKTCFAGIIMIIIMA